MHDNALETSGIRFKLGFEIQIGVNDPVHLSDAERLLDLLACHFVRSPVLLSPGQTIDWSCSLLVAQAVSGTCVRFGEMDFDGRTIHQTVDRTVAIWTQQSNVCEQRGVELIATAFGALIAVSPGVFEDGQRIEGIRYAPKGSMSGWWLFAEDYDGTVDDFKSMTTVHVFDVLRRRVDLARYFGLPPGYAFRADEPEAIWFEADQLS